MHHQTPEVSKPADGAFDDPAVLISPQRTTILYRRTKAIGLVRIDQLDSALPQPRATSFKSLYGKRADRLAPSSFFLDMRFRYSTRTSRDLGSGDSEKEQKLPNRDPSSAGQGNQLLLDPEIKPVKSQAQAAQEQQRRKIDHYHRDNRKR